MAHVLGFGDNVVDKYEHIKTMYPGGNCVNFAVYAKMFGAERPAYMGIFGTDNEAEHVIKTLNTIMIETIKCKQVEGENGCARATIIDGDRIFLGGNDGGIRKTVRYILDRFDIEYIKSFDLVHSGNYSYTENELSKIKAACVPISFDFSDDSSLEYYKEVAPNVDYAFMSCGDMEEESIKEKLKTVADYGCKIIIATCGAKGSIAYNGKAFIRQQAILTDATDTMGAGDSLITAFLIEYINRKKAGRNDDELMIQESLLSAAKFAARMCTVSGAFGYGVKYDL